MADRFQAKKRDTLRQLNLSADEYADASPKGSIDIQIRELVNQINQISGFVTTSSCSGRIAVFLEGRPYQTATALAKGENGTNSVTVDGNIGTTSSSGKGGGRWLFTSHEPLDLEHNIEQGKTFAQLGLSPLVKENLLPQKTGQTQYIHFKFEPMILHIQTESGNHAQLALNAAMSAGFRESGISGLFDRKGRPWNPTVAVRSSGLAMDSIIGFHSPDLEPPGIIPMVSESYLKTLIAVANERFEGNLQRKERFRHAFFEQVGNFETSLSALDGKRSLTFEPASLRKERKREEGLRRREALRASASNTADWKHGEDTDEEDGSFGFDLL